MLKNRDSSQINRLFSDDCYWRDLVAFTWNIKTLEGQQAIKEMLDTTLSDLSSKHWAIEGEASETDGVIEAWITFETETCRGKGHIRFKGEVCWTLLTTMVELKGFEEKKGSNQIKGAEHGVPKGRLSWKDKQEKLESELGYSKQPYCLVIGGGQGGIALGARLKQLSVPTLIIEKINVLVTLGVTVISHYAYMIPFGTTIYLTFHFLKTGQCFHLKIR